MTENDAPVGSVNMDLLFPILPGIGDKNKTYVPWDFVAPHEAQAQRNHGQTLKRLKERGGLSPTELLMVLRGDNGPFKSIPDAAAWMEIFGLYRVFVAKQVTARRQPEGAREALRALVAEIEDRHEHPHDPNFCDLVESHEFEDAKNVLNQHASDCAIHNAPAYPAGKCDCAPADPLLVEARDALSDAKEFVDQCADAPELVSRFDSILANLNAAIGDERRSRPLGGEASAAARPQRVAEGDA